MIFASDWLWLIEHFGDKNTDNWIPWQVNLFLSIHIVIITGSDFGAFSIFRSLAVSTLLGTSWLFFAQRFRNLTPTDQCFVDRESLSTEPPGSLRTG